METIVINIQDKSKTNQILEAYILFTNDLKQYFKFI